VRRRTNRKLYAGKLYFAISSGGAHVYCINERNFEVLLQHKPIPGIQPFLEVETDLGLFEMAQKFDEHAFKKPVSLNIHGYHNEYRGQKFHPGMKMDQAA
jgi:hypothetical protein